jgi:hypothetical protein
MIDIVDAFHYLIGIIIVVFLLWGLIQVHNYFSKDNDISFSTMTDIITHP